MALCHNASQRFSTFNLGTNKESRNYPALVRIGVSFIDDKFRDAQLSSNGRDRETHFLTVRQQTPISRKSLRKKETNGIHRGACRV